MSDEPPLASQSIEEAMERKDVPESDRDEVRRFSEFLERYKQHKEGKPLGPAPDGMRDWLLGK